MHFPSWIESERDQRKRATLRLKHMLSLAALNRFGRTSMHDLAREAGVNHSSIFNAIARGWFTDEMAARIEGVFGPDKLPKACLTNPLSVECRETA